MLQVTVEVGRLRRFMDGEWGPVREEVRSQIESSPLLRPVHGLSIEEHRARVLEQAKLVSRTRSARLFFPREYGGEADIGGALSAFETLALIDVSLLVKIGVHNGRLWFDQVRVPREALLDRFGQVSADGSYQSPIANETRRFFTMLGTLVSGRVSVAGSGLSAARLALTIAIRYGLTRRQFRAPN